MYIKLLFVLGGVFGVSIRQEQIESSQLTFRYDPTSHLLVAHNKVACFLAQLLGQQERDMVHTDRGMAQLEIQMMFDWIGKVPEVLVYHTDHSIPQTVLRMCANQLMYFLDRTGQHIDYTRTSITVPPTSSLNVPTMTLHPDASTDTLISHTPEHTDTTIAHSAPFVISSTNFPTPVPSKDTYATGSSKGTDATVSSIGTYATVSSKGIDTTVPSKGTDATVSSKGTDATVSSIGTDATVSREGADTTLSSEGTYTTLSREGTYTTLTMEGTYTTLSSEGTYTTVSKEGTDTTVSREGTDTTVSREGTDTTVSRAGTYTTVSREGMDTTVSREETDTTVSREGTDTTVSREGTGTTISSKGTDTTFSSKGTDTTVSSKGAKTLTSATSVTSVIAASGSTFASSQHASTIEFVWPPSMVFYGPISATSPHQTYPTTTHARPERSGHMTTPSTTESFVKFYDRKEHITYAVNLSPSNECYVYRISDLDHQLLSTATKQDIYTALLSAKRDSSHLWTIVTGQIGSMSPEVRTFCTGPVYMLKKPFRF